MKRQKRIAVRRAVETRKVYRFEDLLGGPIVSIVPLRRLIQRVWRENARPGRKCPEVVAGRGTKHCGRWVSYCYTPKWQGEYRIVLSRNQRKCIVALHEVNHALGPYPTHGRRFQQRYADLIARYL